MEKDKNKFVFVNSTKASRMCSVLKSIETLKHQIIISHFYWVFTAELSCKHSLLLYHQCMFQLSSILVIMVDMGCYAKKSKFCKNIQNIAKIFKILQNIQNLAKISQILKNIQNFAKVPKIWQQYSKFGENIQNSIIFE